MKPVLLFPSSYFDISKVDEALRSEFYGAVDSDQFDICLFNYDQWVEEESLLIYNQPKTPVKSLYRGWMMKPDQYEKFYRALEEKGIILVTKPDQYKKLHSFPNVYPEIMNDTARMLIYPEGTRIDIEEVKEVFPKFMVKDYVKSVKWTNFPKYFDETVNQESFDKWMEIFYQFRDSLFTGGICIKEFLPLKHYCGKNNEYRVFVADGNILSIMPNSGQGNLCPKPPTDFVNRFLHLGSPFYTVDIAELEDGTWKIIETGDGGVSGLSDNQNEAEFYRKLGVIFQD